MNLLENYNKIRKDQRSFGNGFLSMKIFPGDDTFRIALDSDSNPTILISENVIDFTDWKKGDHRLKHLELSFHVSCDVKDLDADESIKKTFTVVKQIDGNDRMKEYFLRVAEGIISELKKDFSLSQLNKEIEYLLELFSSNKKVDAEKVLGLWGELVFIYSSKHIDTAIDAWHQENENLFDFTFIDCVREVKTTTNHNRVHQFNNNQIKHYKALDVYVVSIITEKVTIGNSINDLWGLILEEDICREARLKLTKLIGRILKNDVVALNDYNYNLDFALSTLKEFDSKKIPSIDFDVHGSIKKISLLIELNSL